MTDHYKIAFRQAKVDYSLAQKELGQLNERKADLEARIAGLRETIIALSRMCGEEFDEADGLGLTEAIRQTFMAQQNVQLTAENVRDRLEFLGFSLKKYSNALASIHTVIRRLLEKGEIDEVSPTREAEKTAYIWRKSIGRPISKISNAPPPPRTL